MMTGDFSSLRKFSSLLMIVSLMLAGCTATASAPTPTALPPTKAPTATATAKPQATATLPPETVFVGGGELDDAQKEIVKAFELNPEKYPKMKMWDDAIKGYWDYWLRSKTVETSWLQNNQIPVGWMFDEADPYNPDKVTAYVDIAAFGGDGFSVPLVNGEPQLVAPTELVIGQNETGQMPLPLTKAGTLPDGTQYFLGSDKGVPTRRDKPFGQNGDIIQDIDPVTGQFVDRYQQFDASFVLKNGETLILPGFKSPKLLENLEEGERLEIEKKLLEKAIEEIVESGVDWGRLISKKVGDSTGESKKLYDSVILIPSKDPIGAMSVPRQMNLNPKDQFMLGFWGVQHEDNDGTLLIYYDEKSDFSVMYIEIPVETAWNLIDRDAVTIPTKQ